MATVVPQNHGDKSPTTSRVIFEAAALLGQKPLSTAVDSRLWPLVAYFSKRTAV